MTCPASLSSHSARARPGGASAGCRSWRFASALQSSFLMEFLSQRVLWGCVCVFGVKKLSQPLRLEGLFEVVEGHLVSWASGVVRYTTSPPKSCQASDRRYVGHEDVEDEVRIQRGGQSEEHPDKPCRHGIWRRSKPLN